METKACHSERSEVPAFFRRTEPLLLRNNPYPSPHRNGEAGVPARGTKARTQPDRLAPQSRRPLVTSKRSPRQAILKPIGRLPKPDDQRPTTNDQPPPCSATSPPACSTPSR